MAPSAKRPVVQRPPQRPAPTPPDAWGTTGRHGAMSARHDTIMGDLRIIRCPSIEKWQQRPSVSVLDRADITVHTFSVVPIRVRATSHHVHGCYMVCLMNCGHAVGGRDVAFGMSACSVAVSYKPPMLVTRVRLPACALWFLLISERFGRFLEQPRTHRHILIGRFIAVARV